MSKPHIVHIPGAWHGPFYLDTVNQKLQALGYTVHARQFPAIGATKPPIDLSEDIACVHSLVDEAIGSEGNDVVVICHSWGGILASSALEGYGKAQREKAGKKGGVVRVGYLAAFIAEKGVSLMDSLPEGKPLPWFDLKDPYVYPKTGSVFYNDLPESEQEHWFSKVQSHSLATFTAKATGTSWREIPISYWVCEDDQAIPAAAQDGMIAHVRSQGVEVEVDRVNASHSPFLSRPDETVAWIEKVAGKK